VLALRARWEATFLAGLNNPAPAPVPEPEVAAAAAEGARRRERFGGELLTKRGGVTSLARLRLHPERDHLASKATTLSINIATPQPASGQPKNCERNE